MLPDFPSHRYYNFPSHRYNFPSHRYNFPSHRYNFPSHRYNFPSHRYNFPSHRYNFPSHRYNFPSHRYNFPSHRYNFPSHTYNFPYEIHCKKVTNAIQDLITKPTAPDHNSSIALKMYSPLQQNNSSHLVGNLLCCTFREK